MIFTLVDELIQLMKTRNSWLNIVSQLYWSHNILMFFRKKIAKSAFWLATEKTMVMIHRIGLWSTWHRGDCYKHIRELWNSLNVDEISVRLCDFDTSKPFRDISHALRNRSVITIGWNRCFPASRIRRSQTERTSLGKVAAVPKLHNMTRKLFQYTEVTRFSEVQKKVRVMRKFDSVDVHTMRSDCPLGNPFLGLRLKFAIIRDTQSRFARSLL